MNAIQIKLETFRKAAHAARFEPSGKPFNAACDMVERLERVLRSIAQLAEDDDFKSTLTEIKSLAKETLG